HGLGLLGHVLLKGAVRRLGLVKNDRVGIENAGPQQRPGIARSRRYYNLQPGQMHVDRLAALGMMLDRANAAAIRHADDHRARIAAARAIAIARDVILDLVERVIAESRKLHLADRL